jgi:glycosyltransferase involved in cell wall biosynthesis
VRTLAAGTGGVVLAPAATGARFGFERFVPVEPSALLTLRRTLRDLAPEIVHAHGLRAGACAVLAVRSLARRRPRIVVTIHNGEPHPLAARVGYRMLELTVARGADMVLTVSGDLTSRMRSAGARRVEPAVIAAPATPTMPARAGTSPRTRPIVLAVGRLASQKSFATLIAAVPSWRDLDPAPRVVIAGTGPLESDLRSQAAQLGADVEFLGHRDDIASLLESAAVFVMPSVWEGQPLVLQEALRAGVPIVASRVGGIPAMTGRDAAILVRSDDVIELAAAVHQVLTDRAFAARLRAAALARAVTLPSESDAVAAVLSVYQRLMSSRVS